MMNSEMTGPAFPTGMIRAGTVLIGGGLMIATVGMALTAAAVTRGMAAWAKQREVSPAALAADKLHQVRYATLAGAHAWREHAPDSSNGHPAHAAR